MKQMPHTNIRNSLSAAIAIALTVAAGVPTRAYAQQATASADAQVAPAKKAQAAQSKKTQAAQAKSNASTNITDLNKVTVTGYRYSIEKSLDQKRDANAIVDVVTAEDVGKFPDKNVADALQRVPGVIISRDGGEGKNVSVRGLSSELTLTELNGNYVATAESNGDPTRSFNYTLLPSNMLSSAELFKTPEARIDEGGIGGTVILHTRKPLEQEANTGYVSAEGTWADTTKKTDGQFSGSYSWHDKDDRFGVFVGYTDQKRTTRTMGANTENWQWYGRDEGGSAVDVNGQQANGPSNYWGGTGFYDQSSKYYTGFAMPTSVDFSVKNENRERKGGQLTLQFKPTDNLTLTANYFRFNLSQNSATNTLKIPEWNLARWHGDGNWPGGRMLDGLTFDPSRTIVNGAQYSAHPGKTYYCNSAQAAAGGLTNTGGFGPDDCTIPTPQITGSYNIQKALSQTADFGAEWVGESFEASVKAGRTWASGGPNLQFTLPIKPRKYISGSGTANETWALGNHLSAWDLSGKTPTMTFSPDLMANLLNGIEEADNGSTGSSWIHDSTKQKYAQADFTWHNDEGFLDSLQFGAKYRDGGIHRSTGNNYWVCPGTDPSNYDNRFQNGGCPSVSGVFPANVLYAMPNLTDGIRANQFPAINYPAFINYLNQTYGAMQTRNEDNFIYNVNEKIWSTYLQANFKTESGLRGNIGVRLAHTEQHADSTDQVDYYNAYFYRDSSGGLVNCVNGSPGSGAPAGSGCQGGYSTLPDSNTNPATGHVSSYALSSVDRTYTDVLPSFNLAYDLTDSLLLRAAASKVISRPSYADIASPGSLNYCSQQYITDHQVIGGGACSAAGWWGNGSNKNLQPYKANQFDLGLEWYFHPGSVLGLDLFRKNVSNFSVPVVQDISMNVDTSNIKFNGTAVTTQNPVTVQQYSTTAGGRNGISQGIEFYAQHTLDFGLGFQVNYTYNDTNEAAVTLADGTNIGKSPLIGSAKNQANFTVFYETQKLLLRASYNRRGEVVQGLDNGLNVYDDPYKQIDLNAAYNFTPAFSITASVLNLTKEVSHSHLGNDTKDRFYSDNYAGRVAYMGLTYKF